MMVAYRLAFEALKYFWKRFCVLEGFFAFVMTLVQINAVAKQFFLCFFFLEDEAKHPCWSLTLPAVDPFDRFVGKALASQDHVHLLLGDLEINIFYNHLISDLLSLWHSRFDSVPKGARRRKSIFLQK